MEFSTQEENSFVSVQVEAVIERMKADASVTTDRDLAVVLEIDPSTISSWRRRNGVPTKYVVKATLIRDQEISARHENRTSGDAQPWKRLLDGYVFSLIGLAAIRIFRSEYVIHDDEENEILRGFRLRKLHHILDAEFRAIPEGDKAELRKLFEERKVLLRSDDALLWIETA